MLSYFRRNKNIFFASFVLAGILFGILYSSGINQTFAETETLNEEEIVELNTDKFVTIFDQNEKKTVKTDAKTIRELLERLKISLSETDRTDPTIDTEINANNFFINVYRSRPIIVMEGSETKIIMTSSFDTKSIFKDAKITIYDGDEIKIIENPNFLETGISTIYKIQRNGGRTVTVEEEIPFEEKEEKDYNLEPGETKIIQLGEVGKRELVYRTLYIDGEEVERELININTIREPVTRIIAIGAAKVSAKTLTAGMGRNYYTTTNLSGETVERQETYYDLPMSGVMSFCGESSYTVREDGAKIDKDGYVLVAANLSRYPRCSIVETSLGPGKVYDTGGFATSNPEQFDLATDWSNHDGR